MSSHFWIVYLTTIFVASIVPGPSMLLALSHGVRYGAGRAVFSGLGNVAASLLQASLSIAGLGVLIVACAPFFFVIKYAGAAYLVWLGVSLWRSSGQRLQVDSGNPGNAARSRCRLFADAFMVALGNPKAIVFFSALFPQFIDAGELSFSHCSLLLLGLASQAFLAWMLYAFGGQRLGGLLQKLNAGRILNKVLGTGFLGMGVGLAFSDR